MFSQRKQTTYKKIKFFFHCSSVNFHLGLPQTATKTKTELSEAK